MATATEGERRARVAHQLASLRAADERLSRALDDVLNAATRIPERAIDREPLGAVEAAAKALREPPPADVAEISARGPTGSAARTLAESAARPSNGGRSASTSEAVQEAFGAVSDAGAVATALFTTARLMFLGTACTFADERSQAYAATSKALHDLLPQVVAWELREAGLHCQCICPMCGLGACGCVWASLHTVSLAWGRPGLLEPDERGIPLRTPPRPGSQLAEAGVQQWAHISAVDGEAVRSPVDLQIALRGHSIGEEVRLQIDEAGRSREITVTHVSDMG